MSDNPSTRWVARHRTVKAIQFDGANARAVEDLLNEGCPVQWVTVEPVTLPGPGRGITRALALTTLQGVQHARPDTWITSEEPGSIRIYTSSAFRQDYEPL